MAIQLKDNSTRLAEELVQLSERNQSLQEVLENLASFASLEFNKDVIITAIYRTQEEQDKIYKGKVNARGVSYDANPWKSPHQLWEAIDIRSTVYNSQEIQRMLAFLNCFKYRQNQPVAIYHNVGLGDHFHIQYQSKRRDMI